MKPKTYVITGEPNQDFAEFTNKKTPLPQNYKYINKNVFARFFSFIAYYLIGKPIVWLISKLHYHQKIVGAKSFRHAKGCYIYANHTMAVGDALLPNIIRPKKNYTIIGDQAKTLKWIQPLIRAAGGIPLPDTIKQTKELISAMGYLTDKGNSIIIYPEAHVWPYYTGIRKFPAASFTYPVMDKKPIFVITNCFQKRKVGKKIRLVTYIDGPFYPDESLSVAQNKERLCEIAYEKMSENARKHSTYSYNNYITKEDAA